MTSTRRGVSLIQLLIVMSVMSVITAVSTFTLLQMFRIESLSSRNYTEHLGRMRLAEEFRQDVHAAVTVELAEADSDPVDRLTFKRHDGTSIVYEGTEGQVTRTATTSGGRRQSDVYPLGSGRIHFSRVADWGGVELAHVRTNRAVQEESANVRTWRVQARLGKATGVKGTTADGPTVAEALP